VTVQRVEVRPVRRAVVGALAAVAVSFTMNCRRSLTPGQVGAASASSSPPAAAEPSVTPTFAQLRAKFVTTIVRDPASRGAKKEPPPIPPKSILTRVRYPSRVGDLWAYLTPPPSASGKYPAMVWAPGGFQNAIDDFLFDPPPPGDDQSAAAFREAGIVLMVPSWRGGNDNPGRYEELYGEVDDFIAALAYVHGLPYVDPERIYIGGHSTGATLVLLAAETTDGFRAGFAFGPVGTAKVYGEAYAPFDPKSSSADLEWKMRSPVLFVRDVHRPVFVFEGAGSPNVKQNKLLAAKAAEAAAALEVRILGWGDHFSIQQPMSRRIAEKIVADVGSTPRITFTSDDLAPP
jgi:dienelactone hydrolase